MAESASCFFLLLSTGLRAGSGFISMSLLPVSRFVALRPLFVPIPPAFSKRNCVHRYPILWHLLSSHNVQTCTHTPTKRSQTKRSVRCGAFFFVIMFLFCFFLTTWEIYFVHFHEIQKTRSKALTFGSNRRCWRRCHFLLLALPLVVDLFSGPVWQQNKSNLTASHERSNVTPKKHAMTSCVCCSLLNPYEFLVLVKSISVQKPEWSVEFKSNL